MTAIGEERPRVRAAQHGRSMEAEVREILRTALKRPTGPGMGTRIRQRFAEAGGVDLPSRADRPRVTVFDD